MDELIDIATIKPGQKFDNPFVISFLANTTYNGSYAPPNYYTQFEFSRLTFSATGQLKDITPELKRLLCGSLIVGRHLCRELLFNTKKYLPDLVYGADSIANLETVGLVIYNTYLNAVKDETPVVPDNLDTVTMDDPPTTMEGGLGYKDEAAGQGN